MELIKRILAYFFTTLSDLQAAQLLIVTGKSDKEMINIILFKFVKPHHIRKSNMKPKFFSPDGINQIIVIRGISARRYNLNLGNFAVIQLS